MNTRTTNHICDLCGKPISEGVLAFRDDADGFRKPYHVTCRENANTADETAASAQSREPTLLHAHERSHGWYDVYDDDGNKINLTPVRKSTALAFVEESNRGEITDDSSGDSGVHEVKEVPGEDPKADNGPAHAGTDGGEGPEERRD